MRTVEIAGYSDDIDLSWEQLCDALGALEGSRVAVRVVERADPETLFAAFQGTLGALDHGKRPALFWPVDLSGEQEPAAVQDAGAHLHRAVDHQEGAGLYLRRDRFEGAVGLLGATLLVLTQGPVLINVRRP
jgi:hypothetical protein